MWTNVAEFAVEHVARLVLAALEIVGVQWIRSAAIARLDHLVEQRDPCERTYAAK